MNLSYPLDKAAAARLVRASLLLPVDDVEATQATRTEPEDSRKPAVLAIGAFDGLHLGHRSLLASSLADARSRGASCIAVTFDPDPSDLLRGAGAEPHLLSVCDRVRGLASLGVDDVVTLSFDHDLASLSPRAFVENALATFCHPIALHVGSNFHFGRHGSGDVGLLRRLGGEMGFSVEEMPLLKFGSERVSSTRIRSILAQGGRIAEANELLGRCHFLRGRVEHGRGQGTSFGFPTANVRFPSRSCMPAQGVYGGYVSMGGSAWPAAINVGAPPTFSDPDELFCEANLIGFSGDVYDADVCVTFVEWLRPSRPFDSLEELERVVLGNIDWVRTNLGDGEVEATA